MSGAGRFRVLVVDDNADLAELLSVVLRKHGYEVDTACTVASGLEALCTWQHAVAIVDLDLPDGDGAELVRQFADRCPCHATRFIALSGYARELDVARAHRAGFHAHLGKPATSATILSCLAAQRRWVSA